MGLIKGWRKFSHLYSWHTHHFKCKWKLSEVASKEAISYIENSHAEKWIERLSSKVFPLFLQVINEQILSCLMFFTCFSEFVKTAATLFHILNRLIFVHSLLEVSHPANECSASKTSDNIVIQGFTQCNVTSQSSCFLLDVTVRRQSSLQTRSRNSFWNLIPSMKTTVSGLWIHAIFTETLRNKLSCKCGNILVLSASTWLFLKQDTSSFVWDSSFL